MKWLKNIWLGVVLITAASLVLLLSDLNRRQGGDARSRPQALPRLAVMQWTSTGLLDSTVEGIIEGLRQQGFENGRTASIRFYNASGDPNTGTMMARELVGGGYDMVITASTLAMQAVANANREGRVLHLFGAVTDPYGAGVDITGPEPHQHPRHLLGVGTFQPVETSFRIAQQMNPQLRQLGVVWNSSEDNSEACVKIAREICKELGITLIEAIANNTSEVPEAVRSVLGRGAEAVWIGGDMVAMASIHAIVSAANAEGVPVFSNDPTDIQHGALFGLGASYEQVGLALGDLAGTILRGTDPATIGVKNLVPEVLALNEALAADLPNWTLTDALHQQAAATQALTRLRTQTPEVGRTYTVGVLYVGPHPVFEIATTGIQQALREAGFVEGENLTVHVTHTNDDLSMLPQVIQRLLDRNLDVILPLSTPCLAGVLAAVKEIPIVFGVVSAPLEAGAGESFENHLPNVTGAVWTAPAPGSFDWIRMLFPEAKTLGVIYNPAHANSRMQRDLIAALCAKHGLTLVERNLSTPSEITAVLQSLLQAGPDVVFGMGDNTVVSAFPAVANACRQAGIPLVADDNSLMGTGALFSIGGSPLLEGRHTGRLAARVLLGENPADIPFQPSVASETAVDFAAARALGITFPVEKLKEVDIFHNLHRRYDRPLHIARINLVQSHLLERSEAGILRGLRESGLIEGSDFTVHDYNAQGEISQLPALLDAARQRDPDVIITITTPAMIAAAQQIRDIPVVFSVSSDPVALGIFPEGEHPANLTGVHDDPPLDRLLEMAMRHVPGLSAVGIVFDPAQPNAVLSVEKLRRACNEKQITLYEANATTLTDLAPAVQALAQRGAGALLLSADNLVSTGFATIQRTAEREGLPIFVTSIDLVAQGATGAVGDDYEAWGAQAGRLAATVLAGVPPSAIPLQVTREQQVIPPKIRPQAQTPPRRKPFELRIVRYNDAVFSADSARGILDGLAAAGWREGREFNVRTLNAQGDMSTLSSILTAVVSEQPDLILPISTPALQASLRQAGTLPVVFCSVADAVQAGAGSSATDHLPHVTGITSKSPFEGMARLIRLTVPDVKTVGTLFSPSEINSELYRHWFEEALKAEGLSLISVPVNSSADTAEATTVLLRSNIQVIAQIADNATRPGYSQIIRRADEAGIPFFSFDSAGMSVGATLALARDYYHTGVEAAAVAIRVLQGESPEHIPFTNTQTEMLVIHPKRMERFGLRVPPEFQAQSTIYTE